MIPLFKHVGNVGFCDGTHRKEEGIRKYNEFLLKANNKLKEENETLKVTTKRYIATVGIMLIDSSSIDKGAVGCKQTKHAVCCFSNSKCDRYRSCNQTDTSLKYLSLSLSLVKCILNPTDNKKKKSQIIVHVYFTSWRVKQNGDGSQNDVDRWSCKYVCVKRIFLSIVVSVTRKVGILNERCQNLAPCL